MDFVVTWAWDRGGCVRGPLGSCSGHLDGWCGRPGQGPGRGLALGWLLWSGVPFGTWRSVAFQHF